MDIEFPKKARLFCPGPTTVPHASAVSGLDSEVYHRSSEFKKEILMAREALQPFFQSSEPPLILSSSGTGAMEAALVNLTNAGDKVIVVNGGKFGDRWSKLAEAYACTLVEIKLEWGKTISTKSLNHALEEHPDTRAVFFQANETSTGVAHPVETLAKAIRHKCPEALIVVDAVSALVAHKIPMTDLDIDCLLSGSQKGFGVPPGLAFIALSNRAWSQISERPKFYFDLKKERSGQSKGVPSWTPPTSLIRILNTSLNTLSKLGVNACEAYHQKAGRSCRAAAKALNLELFSQSDHSNALTAIKLPDSIDGNSLIKHAKDRYGIVFAGGQDEAKGKIIRVAHLGIFDIFDVITSIAALEYSLADQGFSLEIGKGVAAAMLELNS